MLLINLDQVDAILVESVAKVEYSLVESANEPNRILIEVRLGLDALSDKQISILSKWAIYNKIAIEDFEMPAWIPNPLWLYDVSIARMVRTADVLLRY